MSTTTNPQSHDGAAPNLWRQPDFVRLWLSETVSLAGSQITLLALPLTAVTLLQVSAGEMGLLRAATTAPALLFGLIAGVWVDRLPRRPIAIGADVGRALVLVTIPLAALADGLRIEHLYAVAFIVAILTLFFDVAHMSLVPSLIARTELVAANGKLMVSRSVASIAGPGLAGALIQLFTAPVAILVDVLSFIVSALLLGQISTPEPPRALASERNLIVELRAGLGAVIVHPILRPIAGSTAIFNLFANVFAAVYILYLARDLALTAGVIGVIAAGAGIGALLGTLVAPWAVRHLGVGPTVIRFGSVSLVAPFLIAVVGGPMEVVIGVLITAQFLLGFGGGVYNLTLLSLRQAITPNELLGRVAATMRFLTWGIGPLGALLGGVLGEWLGLRATIVVGAVGMLLSLPWLVFSPVRTLQQAPEPSKQ